MSEAAPRPGIGDRCLAAMFGLYLRCKGITEDTAREIFKGHVGSRRPCVLAWLKVRGRSSIDDLASGRLAPALPNLAVEWAASSSPARDLAGLQPRLQQAAETSQHLHHAGRMEDFAVHACADVLHKELVTQWRERFARACAGAAWDDSEVRALMSLQPDEEQLKLREEITALAQKAGQRAGAPLERDPEPLAVQIVAGEITIHRALRTIPQNPDLAGEGNGSAGRSTHGSSSSALLDAPKRGLPPAGDIRARALPHIRR